MAMANIIIEISLGISYFIESSLQKANQIWFQNRLAFFLMARLSSLMTYLSSAILSA